MRIKHCGKSRDTKLYWFICNTIKDVDFKVYALTDCPVCQQGVVEFNVYSNTDTYLREWERLKQKDHESIYRLIKMGMADFETTGSGKPIKQDWQTKPIVSDYTRLISSGSHAAINSRVSKLIEYELKAGQFHYEREKSRITGCYPLTEASTMIAEVLNITMGQAARLCEQYGQNAECKYNYQMILDSVRDGKMLIPVRNLYD